MKKKQTEDIVAGRLAGVSAPKARPIGFKRRLASYGSERLGIASDADGEAPVASTPPPAASLRVADVIRRPEPDAKPDAKPAAARPRLADDAFARRFRFEPDMEPLVTPVHEQLARWETVRASTRKRGLLISAGALAGVLILAIILIATSGSDQPPPPTWPGPTKAAAAPPDRPVDRQAVIQPQPDQPAQPLEPPVILARPDRGVRRSVDPHAAADLLAPADLLDRPRSDDLDSDDSDAPAPRRRVAPRRAAPAPEPAPEPPAAGPAFRYGPCPPGFRLSGIVRRGSADVAGINGRFVGVGDTVDGAKVLAIVGFSVEMEREGQRFLLGTSAPPAPQVEPNADAPTEEETDKPADDDGKSKKKSPDKKPAD